MYTCTRTHVHVHVHIYMYTHLTWWVYTQALPNKVINDKAYSHLILSSESTLRDWWVMKYLNKQYYKYL